MTNTVGLRIAHLRIARHVANPEIHLEVALVLVDHVLLPSVEQLDEGEVRLILLGDRLVDFFVVFYPFKEVGDGLK